MNPELARQRLRSRIIATHPRRPAGNGMLAGLRASSSSMLYARGAAMRAGGRVMLRAQIFSADLAPPRRHSHAGDLPLLHLHRRNLRCGARLGCWRSRSCGRPNRQSRTHNRLTANRQVISPNRMNTTRAAPVDCDKTEIERCRESCVGCIDCIDNGFTQLPCSIPTGYHTLSGTAAIC